MDDLIFVADYDYEKQNETELSFLVGDTIRVTANEGGWFYGKHTRTEKCGWVSPSYGHTRQDTPYNKMSADVKEEKRNLLLKNIILTEKEFVNMLGEFVQTVITPFNLRDTPFKRSFMGDSSVAVSFSLLQELYKACFNFENVLKASKSDIELANAYIQFAPSLLIFAQYASENAKLLNAIKSCRQLSEVVPESFNIIQTLIHPMQHSTLYKSLFQEYIWLTARTNPDMSSLEVALDMIIAQSNVVDARMKEEEESWKLLNLQAQFSGNPVIFTPTRKLIREGEVERVKLKKGEIDTKLYYAHLFNDAFIYSSRNRVTGGFKLHVAIDLKGATLNHSQIGGSKIFSLLAPKENAEGAPKLRFPKAGETWFLQIQAQIDALKVVKKDKRGSMFVQKAQAGLPGVDASSLGVRGMMIYQFVLAEMQFAELMAAMNVTVIQPLIDASKGAVLSAVKIKNLNTAAGSADAGPELKDLHSDALFNSNASSVSKSQALVIKDALSDPDVKIFLRAAEGIALASRDFVSSLETLCTSQSWTENTAVGAYFNSVSALALYNQFKAYTDGQQAVLRILRTAPFSQFYRDAETFLSAYPGSFAEKIEQPRQRVNHYTAFLFNLKNCTPPTSSDFGPIEVSLSALTFVNNEIQELIRVKENFEKLLEIQGCFINNFITVDPVLAKLASTDRTFIKEGDLKKVCRKKNKVFRFWLFNDYLIYGTGLGGGTYSFNRALDLKTCSVKAHESSELKNAFELFGAEKSFIVIAPTTLLQDEWLQAIKTAKAAIMGVSVQSLDTAVTDTAPLWVPDSESQGCIVCKKEFTFWNRRHHCRKCGSLVCNEHFQKKLVLPHIHKTSPQKVCDFCFSGVPPPGSTAAGTPNTSTKAVPIDNKSSHAPGVSASVVSAPQMSKAQAQFPPGPSSPAPSAAPVPPAKPQSGSKPPPKPAKGTATADAVPTVSGLSLNVPPAAPSKPAPGAPPPLPSSPPPPVPKSAAPAMPPSLNEEEQQSSGGVTPTRRGSTLGGPKRTRAAPPPPTTAAPPLPVPGKLTPPPTPTQAAVAPASVPAPVSAPVPPPAPTAAKAAPAVASPVISREPAVTPPKPAAPPVPPPQAAVAVAVAPPPPAPPAAAPKPPVPPPQPAAKATPPSRSKEEEEEELPPPEDEDELPPPEEDDEPTHAHVHTYRRPKGVVPPPPVPPPAPAALARPAPPGPPPPPPAPVAALSPPRPPAPPAPPAAGRSPGPPPPPPPPPSTGQPAPPSSSSDGAEVSEEFRKYVKMKSMLPEGAVRQKMTNDGFAAADIEDFLSGKVASLPPPSAQSSSSSFSAAAPPRPPMSQMLQQAPALRSASAAPPRAPPPAEPRRMSLLDEIKKGPQLKAVVKDDARMKQTPVKGAGGGSVGGGLLGMLALEMSKRRFNMNSQNDESSDSDSGFSDSDSDSD